MKKTSFLLVAAAGLFLASCSNSTPASIAKTEADTLSYIIGYDYGQQMSGIDEEINMKSLRAGINDAFADTMALTQEEIQVFLEDYFMVRKPGRALKESADFLASIEAKSGVQKTESGLLYEVVEAGDSGIKATNDADTVVVNYVGKLPNGEEFDSSYERNQPATFPLNGVIKGWAEGIKLVGKGGKINLWIPADLAYGERGAGRNIGPNQAIMFEVELLDVKPVATAE